MLRNTRMTIVEEVQDAVYDDDTTLVMTDEEKEILRRRCIADQKALDNEINVDRKMSGFDPDKKTSIPTTNRTDPEEQLAPVQLTENSRSTQCRRSRRVWIGIGFVVLLIVVIGVIVSVIRLRNEQSPPPPSLSLCQGYFADCDGDMVSNGCETDTATSLEHCGSCGNAALDLGQTCVNGTIECDASQPFQDCDNDLTKNGCETDTLTSPEHCGGCGNAASALGQICVNGTIQCDPSQFFQDCDGDMVRNGCETDTATSLEHCGECDRGVGLGVGQTCVIGTIQCDPSQPFRDCDNDMTKNGCETDTLTSPEHCGGCGNAASALGQTCVDGTIQCDPSQRFQDCDDDMTSNGCETDTATSLDHCGRCGNAVSDLGQTCVNGMIQCDFTQFKFMSRNGIGDAFPSELSVEQGCGVRLTTGSSSTASSMFEQVVFSNFGYSFSMYAAYRIFGEAAFQGKGMAFVMHQDPAGTEALGNGGRGLGYSSIEPALVVEFDSYSGDRRRDVQHIAVWIASAPIYNSTTPVRVGFADMPVNLQTSEDGITAGGIWVDFDGTLLTVCHNRSDAFSRPDNPVLAVDLPIESLFNGEVMNVGFTAATDTFADNQDIVAWSFTPH